MHPALVARRRRIAQLRRNVAVVALSTFALFWGVVAWNGSMGEPTTTAQATTTTTTDQSTATEEPTPTATEEATTSSDESSDDDSGTLSTGQS